MRELALEIIKFLAYVYNSTSLPGKDLVELELEQ